LGAYAEGEVVRVTIRHIHPAAPDEESRRQSLLALYRALLRRMRERAA